MIPISIKFQAYIPKSLGKPLFKYFESDYRLENLVNKDFFIKKLRDFDEKSKGCYWIPEPYSNSCFCTTDNIDIHDHHTEHTMRLGFYLNIDPDKIGRYKSSDSFLLHKKHKDETVNNNQQHSGLSHQVEAYIKRLPYYDHKDEYIGVVSKVKALRSLEKPLVYGIRNICPFGSEKFNSTEINISASAGYPFSIQKLTPNIDFNIFILIEKDSHGLNIRCSGWHNDFPAYELVVNSECIYVYKPTDSGPGLFNLGLFSTHFCETKRIWL